MSVRQCLCFVAGVAVLCSDSIEAFVSSPRVGKAFMLATETSFGGGTSGGISAWRSTSALSFAAGTLAKPWYRSVKEQALTQSERRSSALAMTATDDKAAKGMSNAGALGVAVACSAGASAIAEISPHAAAFVQLVCLSVWLGMSVYATFLWPVITAITMKDSSEFATLLGKLGPSYLQLSAAMIMSLATSSVVIGHTNEVQLVILGAALAIILYNVVIQEPRAVDALEEQQEAERRLGRKAKNDKDFPKIRAQVANVVGAEVLLDLLAILCAVAYAWDLASSISFK